MTDSIKRICNLCGHLEDNNFTVIEDCTKEMLQMLFLKHKFVNVTGILCSGCSVKLFEAYEFKSTCLHTENSIKIHVYCEERLKEPLDMWEIYIKEIDNKQLVNFLDDRKVCRICMELITGDFTAVQNVDSVIFQRFIPEINLHFTKDPVVCKVCFDSLQRHACFLESCINMENGFIENKRMVCIKNEHGEVEGAESLTEVETVSVKSEATEDNRSKSGFESQQPHNQNNLKEKLYKCDICDFQTKYNHGLLNHQIVHRDTTTVKMYKCSECDHQTKYKRNLKQHQLIHLDDSKINLYKCDKCDYRTKYKQSMQLHLLRHQDLPGIHKCNTCDFQTNSKQRLSNHERNHAEISETEKSGGAPVYKCHDCDYETKHRHHLTNHALKHKDFSEVTTYKCEYCPFQTKYKRNVTQHLLVHRNESKIEVFKCDVCDFQAKRKKNLLLHQKRHKDVSEVQMFKCGKCDFQSKYKRSLVYHELNHRDESEVELYQCDKCEYRTRIKENVIRHQVKHKEGPGMKKAVLQSCFVPQREAQPNNLTEAEGNVKTENLMESRDASIKREKMEQDRVENLTEIQPQLTRCMSPAHLYTCNDCNFQTKYKNNLVIHCLRHKKDAEVKMYKCNECDYESKYKPVLLRHQLIHRDASEVKMYKCEECNFQSKHARSLAQHRLRHLKDCDTTFFKCDNCTYQTKHKKNLLVHQMRQRCA